MKALVLLFFVSAHVAFAAAPSGLAEGDWNSIRAAFEGSRHHFFKQEDGSHTARNPGLGWQMEFDANGFTATDGNWTWGLELQSASSSHSSSSSNHLYQTRDHITEWFINDQRGLEQGWIITQPTGPLKLKVRGSLQATVSSQSITFGGQITYSGLKAWDAEGKALRIWFEPTEKGFAVHYDDKDAVYPITIDPIAQNAYLKASNTDAEDQFGRAVAVSGDTVVIGADRESSNATGVNGNQSSNASIFSGAAYVFVKSGAGWSQQAYLKASNTKPGVNFGLALALDGDTLVVAAPFEQSNAKGVNGDQTNTAANLSGAVYVFTRTAGSWSQQAYIKASNTDLGDNFGASVALSGNTLIVGAPSEDSSAPGINGDQDLDSLNQSGAAYVFVRTGTTWKQQAYLKASNPSLEDRFGVVVDVSGNTAVVSSRFEDSNGSQTDNSVTDSGAVYVFTRSGVTWRQQAYLKAPNANDGDEFGFSMALEGDTLLVGAPYESSDATTVNGDGSNNNAIDAGAAYVFTRSGTTWTQQAYLKPNNGATGDNFGYSVALSGDVAVIGAAYEDSSATGINGNATDNSANDAGAAYLFRRYGTNWGQQAYFKASNTDTGDGFGYDVSISGDNVVISALFERSNATGINGIGTDNSLIRAGAAYIISLGETLVTVAKSGLSAPGGIDLAFGAPGFSALSPDGTYLLETALSGSGAKAGKNKSIYSTIAGPLDLAAQTGTFVSGVASLPVGAKITTLVSSIHNRTANTGIFQATVTGSGVNATNNRLLLMDTGTFVTPLARTGIAVASLGGALPSAYREVLQHDGVIDQILVGYSLKSGTAGVTKINDSGLLLMNHSGAVTGFLAREGNGTFFIPGAAPTTTFGQFGRATTSSGSNAFFYAKQMPDIGKPFDALFQTGALNIGSPVKQGEPAGGTIAGEKYGTFIGLTRLDALGLLRARLTGSPAATNEGVWNSGGTLLLRKGQEVSSGVKVLKITRVWGINSGQVVAHVTLTGNKQALILRKTDNSLQILIRTGDPAPGLGSSKITLASLQAIDVDPVNGHYVILGSLKGAPSSANQALWSGHTTLGDNERLPVLRIRKGERYSTAVTPSDVIRGLALKPAVDASGVGGRGLAQIINDDGLILVTVTGDRAAKETLRMTP